jgi:hypothetical protein
VKKKAPAAAGPRVFGMQLQNAAPAATLVGRGGAKEQAAAPKGAAAKAAAEEPVVVVEVPLVEDALLEEVDLNDVVGDGGLMNMSLDESLELAAQPVPEAVKESVDNIDELDEEDPQCVAEYVTDIYRFLRAKEKRHALDAHYMKKTQNDLNGGMRAILLDWLADVGFKFKLLNDTTHMTVMVIDRFLATRHNISRRQLQLVGVGAMLVASKYEEIYAPEVRDFEYICDGAFARQEILDMEVNILNTLGCDICHPTPIHFLRRFSKAARSDSECHTLAKYLTELTAVQHESLCFAPSLIAAAAVHLSRLMFVQPEDEPFTWSATMVHYTGYTRADIQPCLVRMAQWGREIQLPTAKLNAVYRKYSKKFFGVALLRVPTNDELEADL